LSEGIFDKLEAILQTELFMSRTLLLLLIAFALWYGWRELKSRPPGERKRLLWRWGSLTLAAVALLLMVTGRIHWVGGLIAALLAGFQIALRWAPRILPLAALLGQKFGPSTIKTSGLKVTFNFSSGEAEGEVTAGPHAGKALSSLSEGELKAQLAYFQASDKQSALLLQAYLVRRGMAGFSQSRPDSTQVTDTNVSADEAWLILGLEPGADREAIISAHKRLIQKLHPDRGGNDYLAAKVNAARDKLLG
jgi:hypothetical protein